PATAGTEASEAAVASIGTVTVGGKPTFVDAPVAMEEVQQMVARSIEGLTPPNVFVTYTRSAPRTVLAVASEKPTATPTTEPTGVAGTASPADKKLMMQLFGAVAVFGLVAILLTAMLVREKRKQK